MWTLIFGLGVAHADCVEDVSPMDLQQTLDQGWASFADLDEDGFLAAQADAVAQVPCLVDVVEGATAADLHRANGVRAFMDGNEDAAGRSFQAAATAEPDGKLPDDVAPPGGPMDKTYGAWAAKGPGAPMALRPDDGELFYVDGRMGMERPADLPALVQLADADGGLAWSALVPVGGALPGEEPPSERKSKPIATGSPTRTSKTPGSGGGKKTMGILTLASGVGAAALYGTAVAGRLAYDANPNPSSYRLTNAAFMGSAGAGVLTLGLGTATLFTAGGR